MTAKLDVFEDQNTSKKRKKYPKKRKKFYNYKK